MKKIDSVEIKKKLNDGWIKAWMAIEVLAITEDAAESSLRKHVDAMSKEDNLILYKRDFKETQKVPNPFKKGSDAYSKVVEVELLSRRFEQLAYLVMNYAPSSIEIMEPAEMNLKLSEAQTLLNTISELVHNFAAMSQGAVTIRT